MTCVWKAVMQGIPKSDFITINNFNKVFNEEQFVNFLKQNLRLCHNVSINSIELTPQQKMENYVAVKDFDSNSIFNGYYCSTCDPFLILICELFTCSIIHTFNTRYSKDGSNTKIYYHNKRSSRYIIFVYSDGHHMSYEKTIDWNTFYNQYTKKLILS